VVDHLRKAFGDKLLLEDAAFSLPPGVCVSVDVVTAVCVGGDRGSSW
jgi:hypothetical protein